MAHAEHCINYQKKAFSVMLILLPCLGMKGRWTIHLIKQCMAMAMAHSRKRRHQRCTWIWRPRIRVGSGNQFMNGCQIDKQITTKERTWSKEEAISRFWIDCSALNQNQYLLLSSCILQIVSQDPSYLDESCEVYQSSYQDSIRSQPHIKLKILKTFKFQLIEQYLFNSRLKQFNWSLLL